MKLSLLKKYLYKKQQQKFDKEVKDIQNRRMERYKEAVREQRIREELDKEIRKFILSG